MTHEEKQTFYKGEVAKLNGMLDELNNNLIEMEKAKEHLLLMRDTFDDQIDKEQLELELVD